MGSCYCDLTGFTLEKEIAAQNLNVKVQKVYYMVVCSDIKQLESQILSSLLTDSRDLMSSHNYLSIGASAF